MTVQDIAAQLEHLAPLKLAEDFDNVGLLVGRWDSEVSGVLITLDTLENVVEEAVRKKCNLIVSFHPIIFKGLKRITGATYAERAVLKAIENGIAIYCMHTALDNVREGVNGRICDVLNLEKRRILIPKKGVIEKLVTYVPKSAKEALLEKLFEAGAGALGNYTHCSFSGPGEGTFLPGKEANPTLGTRGQLQREEEDQLHLTFTTDKRKPVVEALLEHHPYEEVAYEISRLQNPYQNIGMGMVGELIKPMSTIAFLEFLKSAFKLSAIRHSAIVKDRVLRIAVLGGSGAFAIEAAKSASADVLVTADLKYHEFYQAENRLLLVDIGHFETEQFTKNLLYDYLTEKIPNFAIHLSEVKTNPVNYF